MAISSPLVRFIFPPSLDEAGALRLAETYLKCAGTQVASRLLGCPSPANDIALTGELSDTMLRGAPLCAELRGLADDPDQRSYL